MVKNECGQSGDRALLLTYLNKNRWNKQIFLCLCKFIKIKS